MKGTTSIIGIPERIGNSKKMGNSKRMEVKNLWQAFLSV